jgi:hypothetical protein
MAFGTGNILVTAIQFKPGIVVIEFLRFPVIKTMTFQANYHLVVLKLGKMHIRMTGFAIFL